MKCIPGTFFFVRLMSLEMNKSVPATAAQARLMASGGLTLVFARISAKALASSSRKDKVVITPLLKNLS